MSCLNAAIPPLMVPVSNISFSGKRVSLRRSISMEMGSPPQSLYFLPSTLDDTLAITDPSRCDGDSEDDSCTGDLGGLFNWTGSSTYKPTRQSLWNGSHTVDNDRTPILWFNERIQIANKNIDGFPATQYKSDAYYPNMLGLHEKSNFLSIAESSNLIPSKSWGLWVGSSTLNNSASGSLIMGGFDKARISGNFTRIDRSFDDFLARVYVKSIDYNGPDGSKTPLLEEGKGTYAALLSPENSILELTNTPFQKFVNITQATEFRNLKSWGWPAGTALGNITIKLISGYETTLPAHDLWQPYTGLTSDGTVGVVNESVTVSRIVNHNDGLKLRFGTPFLASTYMTFHPEENYLALAAVNSDPDIQPSIQSFCDFSEFGDIPNTNNNASTPSSSSKAGVIAGVVIGTSAGLALIVTLMWLLWRRRRKTSMKAQVKPVFTELATSSGTQSKFRASDQYARPPTEMPGTLPYVELPVTPVSVRYEM